MGSGTKIGGVVVVVVVAAAGWWATSADTREAPDAAAPPPVVDAPAEATPGFVPGRVDTPVAAPKAPADVAVTPDTDAVDSDQLAADAAAFRDVAGAAMTRKVDAMHTELAAGVAAAGRDGAVVRRFADEALVEIRRIAATLDGDTVDIGAAFGDVERARDAFGARVDATLPPDRATAVKAAAHVRTPEEAATAIDWGIPVDDATAEEVFR